MLMCRTKAAPKHVSWLCDAPKEALVLVHGYLGGGDHWDRQCEALACRFRVLSPTLPGYGNNADTVSPCTIQGYADYVVSVIDRAGISNFHLLGHSMGGMIAQEIAARMPARVIRLVLYSTGPTGAMPGRFETLAASQHRLTHRGAHHSARFICAQWFAEGAASPHYSECLAIAMQASEQAAGAGLAAMHAWSGLDRLSEIKAHTLIMRGAYDACYDEKTTHEMHQSIRRCSLVAITGCSHVIHLEQPELFDSMVASFCAEHVCVPRAASTVRNTHGAEHGTHGDEDRRGAEHGTHGGGDRHGAEHGTRSACTARTAEEPGAVPNVAQTAPARHASPGDVSVQPRARDVVVRTITAPRRQGFIALVRSLQLSLKRVSPMASVDAHQEVHGVPQ